MEAKSDNKRQMFGNRFLKDSANVFEHNAWDNAKWDETQEQQAREKVRKNSEVILSQELQEKYEEEASKYWDKFYGIHQNRFFKDRHWLFTEFPELAPDSDNSVPKNETENSEPVKSDLSNNEQRLNENLLFSNTISDEDAGSSISSLSKAINKLSASQETTILEVGCGVGNTVFPILETNHHSNVFVYCCDFSSVAVSILQSNPAYDEKICKAFVWDITDGNADIPLNKASLDIITLIFVLSAINPEKIPGVIQTLSTYLKPEGVILFRDYGRYDMAELRFKSGHCLQDHFYARGDGTRVYFFTEEELDEMFTKAGLEKIQCVVDRRLQVNRGKLLKMYRVWIQMKYRKPR